jgi:hypothetical protein
MNRNEVEQREKETKRSRRLKDCLNKIYGMKTKLGLLHRRLSGRWEVAEEDTERIRRLED